MREAAEATDDFAMQQRPGQRDAGRARHPRAHQRDAGVLVSHPLGMLERQEVELPARLLDPLVETAGDSQARNAPGARVG